MAETKRATLLKKEPAFASKPDLLIKFLEEYIDNGGDAQVAWVTAGYAESTKRSAMSHIRKNHDLVRKLLDLKIGSHVPSSIKVIVDLMQAEKTPAAVKLKCAQDIMSRAGYDSVIEYTVTDKKPEDMTNTELDSELQKLLSSVVTKKTQVTAKVEH